MRRDTRFALKSRVQVAISIVAAAWLVGPVLPAAHADSLRRLKGPEIGQRFAGKILTDGTHWKETYAPGGKFTGAEMGHAAFNGRWRVDGDRLCKTLPDLSDGCYEVWASGNRIELHYGQAPPLEAYLLPAVR